MERATYLKLFLRSGLAFMGIAFTVNGLRILPLVEVSLILGLCPLITAVLSHFILTERLSKAEVLCLFLSFGGLGMIVFGSTDGDEQTITSYSKRD